MQRWNILNDYENGLCVLKAMMQDQDEEELQAVFQGDAAIVSASNHPLGYLHALSLDGTGDYVNFGDLAVANPGMDSFSMDCWFNTSHTATRQTIIAKSDGYQNLGYHAYITDTDGLYFYIRDSSNAYYVGKGPPCGYRDGNWHHFVASVNGRTSVQVWVDGVALTDSGGTLASVGSISSGKNLIVGAESDLGNLWIGQISGLRFWNYDLSATEASQLYTPSIHAYESGIQLLLDLPGLTDLSGNSLMVANSGATISSGGLNGGNCYLFDGTDDIITVTDATEIQDIWNSGGSLIAWIAPDSDGEGDVGRIAMKAPWWLGVANQAGKMVGIAFTQGYDGDYGIWTTTNVVVPIGAWTMVGISYTDGTANDPVIYVDGKSVSVTESQTPTGSVETDVGADMTIGNNAATGRTFDGKIDRMWLFDIPLTSLQMMDLFRRSRRGML